LFSIIVKVEIPSGENELINLKLRNRGGGKGESKIKVLEN